MVSSVPPPAPLRRRWLRGLILGAGSVVTSALLGSAAMGAWVCTEPGARWAARHLEGAAGTLLGGSALQIGRLTVDPSQGIDLFDVSLTAPTGAPLLRSTHLGVRPQLRSLLRGRVHIADVRLTQTAVTVTRDEDGGVDWAQLFAGDAASTGEGGLPLPLRIEAVALDDVSVDVRGPGGSILRVDGLQGRAVVRGDRRRVDLEGITATAQLAVSDRPPAPLAVAGGIAFDADAGVFVSDLRVEPPGSGASITIDGQIGPTVALQTNVVGLDLASLAPWIGPTPGLHGRWSGHLTAAGPRSAVGIDASVAAAAPGDEAGTVTLRGTVDATSPEIPWSMALDLDHHRVDAWIADLGRAVVLDGEVILSGQGTAWPDEVIATGHWRGGSQEIYGQTLDHVDVALALDHGVLDVSGSRIAGLIGELGVQGTLDLTGGPLDLAVSGSIEADRLAALGIVGVDADGVVSARISGAVSALDRIRIVGEAHHAPFRYAPGIAVDRLDTGFDARIRGARVDANVTLSGEGIGMPGVVARSLSSEGLEVSVVDGEVSVVGQVSLGGVDAGGARAETTTGSVDLRIADGIDADLTLRLDDAHLLDRPFSDGWAHVGVRGDTVGLSTQLYDYGRVVLETQGRYDRAQGSLTLDDLIYRPTPRSTWVSDGEARLTVVEGGVADAHLALNSNLGRLAIDGDLATVGPIHGRIRAVGLSLDVLGEMYPDRFGGLAGTLDLDARLVGDGSVPRIDADLDLRDLYVDGVVGFLDVVGEIGIDGGWMTPDLAVGVADRDLARISGRIPMIGGLGAPAVDPDRRLSTRMAVVPGPLARVADLGGPSSLPEGRISAVLDVEGPLGDLDLTVAGTAEARRAAGAEPGRIEFDVRRRGDTLAFRSELREGLLGRGTIDGRGTTRIGEIVSWATGRGPEIPLGDPATYLADMDVALHLVRLPLQLGVEQGWLPAGIAGDLAGTMVARGDARRPVLEGSLEVIDGRIGEMDAVAAALTVIPQSDGYEIEAFADFADGSLGIAGTLPVEVDLGQDWTDWGAAPMDLRVSGTGIPMGFVSLLDPDLRAVAGTLTIEGQIEGDLAHPRPAARLALREGHVIHRGIGVSWEDVSGMATVEPAAIVIHDLAFSPRPDRRTRAPGATPWVRGRGTATLADGFGGLGSVALDVTLDHGPWLVATGDLTLRADGALAVRGDWPQLQVRGDLALVQGRADVDVGRWLDATRLSPDPRIRIVRGGHAASPPVGAAGPPIYADFDVAVDLDLKRNLDLSATMPFVDDIGGLGATVSRMDLSARLGGEVTVALANGSPTVEGEVTLADGSVRVLQSTFDLRQGTIAFPGGDPYTSALLDLDARMAVDGATLDLHLAGTPMAPEPTLSSAAYPDPTQQMAMLLTGRAPGALSAFEGAGALQSAMNLVLNSLFVGQSLGTFSIEPDGTVRLGVPVSSSIYVASTLSTTNTDPSENAVAAEAEWTVMPRVVASGGIGDRVGWGDLFWEIRF